MNRLGLDTTDCTGISIGNSDLDCAEQGWTNTPDTADGHNAPLPIYPQKSDLPQLANEPRSFLFGVALGIPFGGSIFLVLL